MQRLRPSHTATRTAARSQERGVPQLVGVLARPTARSPTRIQDVGDDGAVVVTTAAGLGLDGPQQHVHAGYGANAQADSEVSRDEWRHGAVTIAVTVHAHIHIHISHISHISSASRQSVTRHGAAAHHSHVENRKVARDGIGRHEHLLRKAHALVAATICRRHALALS